MLPTYQTFSGDGSKLMGTVKGDSNLSCTFSGDFLLYLHRQSSAKQQQWKAPIFLWALQGIVYRNPSSLAFVTDTENRNIRKKGYKKNYTMDFFTVKGLDQLEFQKLKLCLQDKNSNEKVFHLGTGLVIATYIIALPIFPKLSSERMNLPAAMCTIR